MNGELQRPMYKGRLFVAAIACLCTVPGFAQRNVDEAGIGEAVERHLGAGPFTEWFQKAKRLDADAGDQMQKRAVVEDGLETVKLTDLVAPIRFQSGVAQIPTATVGELANILEGMQDRINVRLHLIGHADDRPLSPRLQAIYGDNLGLSRERAGEVAEYFQTALDLPPEAISYAWEGDEQPVASNQTPEGRAMNRRVEVEIWYDAVTSQLALEEFLVPDDTRMLKVCRMETVCKLRYVEGHARRTKIKNFIAPLHYGEESIDVDGEFIERVREAFVNLEDKNNVVVRFVGYTDDRALSGRAERIYGDRVGLSKARARRVALAVQDILGYPTSAIESDGRGDALPLGSNETPQGRALNRRVEVEFWYDDPLKELPNEPQLCPEAAGAELVTRIYDPPWGGIEDLAIGEGQPIIPPGTTDKIRRAMMDVADKANVRVRFVGYTRNERLTRRTASVYGDDIGLSASRARRAMDAIAADMQLEPYQVEFEGRGYVHAEDVVNAGFIQGENSFVAVQVVYDELAVMDNYDGVDITRITRELTPENPLALNLMRITVDGEPIDDPKRSSSDIQRCTDVAFEEADIQFGFDNLRAAPRLSVTAKPPRIVVAEDAEEGARLSDVAFRMYTNYSHFIDRAEVRVFESSQSLESEPLAVVEVDADGTAVWQPSPARFKAPLKELAYVVRAYGADGNFDETRAQPLWFVYEDMDYFDTYDENPAIEGDSRLHASYGENALGLHNIALSSGTVSVRGTGIRPDQEVFVAGRPIPVDEDGSFVAEEILPTGAHTVEVAVVDEQGAGELYLRDLEFESDDWFYVGMADLTLAEGTASGPIDLLAGENSDYDVDSNVDGRLAFFVNGKFGTQWRLTASADTREGNLSDIFSNFMDKNPDSLFRRIDPDYYYPTFGDDSTVEELAPTLGKFFVRVSRQDSHALWGNFKVAYMNNELAQVDRGLYGANARYESEAATDFGEKRFALDAFAAEPGTVPSREEFRGTGGSLYFLRRQDLLAGSERVRIEIRDKASGIVTSVVNLMPALDYDIDYLQGRIVLAEPLASTATDGLLVRNNSLSGDEAYLVVRYEYSPGFDDIDAVSTGGQAHYWLGEYVKLGMTANSNEQDNTDASLNAADLTLRWSAESWLKVQQAKSEGLVSLPNLSNDGGFEFNSYDTASFSDAEAKAERADLSFSVGDFVSFTNARLTAYVQEVEAGYSAPGLTALTDTENYGGTFTLPIADRVTIDAKVDHRILDLGIETEAQEYNVEFQISERWDLSAGYRRDSRVDNSTSVPLTQIEGEREDGVVQLGYDSKDSWNAYAFVQDTLAVTGNREENSRFGVGGSYRLNESLRLDAEVSDGDLGAGGRLGTNYLVSDRTSLYLTYSLEDDRSDDGLRNVRGQVGNLVAGMKMRLADSSSVFLEERYQHTTTMTGLTHGTGISFAPTDSWTLGINTDIGTIEDVRTGAETDRVAGGLQVGFGDESLSVSSGIEYRSDDVEQIDLSTNERSTWLFRNNLKWQINPGSRLLGKLNHSQSDSSLGTFFDGGFTEAVLGYGYRPVAHDRLNALVKYTYFYNVPTTDQVTLQNLAAEFIQKSHVASVDMTYDLTQRITLGGKYAYRLGQVSLDREDPEFFDNNAHLLVLRGDVRFRQNWEFMAEVRTLDMPDLSERRTGLLTTVSRYLGDHLKVGAGYNFTDFSDDLTDLSYDHQGFFLNVTGSM